MISGNDNPKNIASLATVKNMTGTITITGTQLHNLSFFKSLERLRFERNNMPFLDLNNNLNMTRLDFTALKVRNFENLKF